MVGLAQLLLELVDQVVVVPVVVVLLLEVQGILHLQVRHKATMVLLAMVLQVMAVEQEAVHLL
jgi:hypothetical protein